MALAELALAGTLSDVYRFNRGKTLDLLKTIEEMPDPAAVLGWRSGPGRAHIAWQIMHVGVTEAIFATERLAPQKTPLWPELWPRFRGGSTPDDDIPPPALIREVLESSRKELLDTLRDYPDSRLDEIPAALAQRQMRIRDVLYIIAWHEAHHHGQAHFTLNSYKAGHK